MQENYEKQENNEKQPELITAFMKYLNCPCQYFAPMRDDDPIMDAYQDACARGKKEGFLPILITADETLWESLIMNSDNDSDAVENYQFDPSHVAEYRKKMLSFPLKEGKEVTEELLHRRCGEAEEDELDWEEEVLGEMAEGEPENRFVGYWNYGTEETEPMILAEIPAANPWEVFAWLPFGGWNECPDTPDLMAAAKYWYERYGAVPAVMTHDVLEFALPDPVLREQAMQLALEQYVWCPDIVDQGAEGSTVGMLADTLAQSTVWYFWWD